MIAFLSFSGEKTIVAGYEAEQKALKAAVASAEEQLVKAEQYTVDMRMFMKGIREYSEMKELTPEILNTLIKRIEVHNNDKYDGHCHVKVDIYFTAIGMFSMPTEEELQEQMEQYTDKKNA